MPGMANTQIRTRVWRNGILEAENFPFEQVSDYLAEPDCLVWADLLDPDDALFAQLAEELTLDPHAVEDATADHERPKAIRYSTHLFLTAYTVKYDASTRELTTGRVSAFSTQRGFVTVRLDDTLNLDAVVRRWDDNADLLKFGPRALVHGLLDEMVDRYFDTVESLDDAVEEIEDILFDESAKQAREVSRQTFALRRALVDARRAILPMREVVNTVTRRATGGRARGRARALLRGPLRPHPARGRVDRVAARHDHLDLRDEHVAGRHPDEHDHEEADVVGRDHRRAHRCHRLLRPERAVPRLRPLVGFPAQPRADGRDRGRALRLVPPPRLVVGLTRRRVAAGR